jgi:hypothetical protein
MKHVVLKFKPDLVIFAASPILILSQLYGYDMLGPPPMFAVDPQGRLILDCHRSEQWQKSPSGRIMACVTWLTRNSRVCSTFTRYAGQLATFTALPARARTGIDIYEWVKSAATKQKAQAEAKALVQPQPYLSAKECSAGSRVVEAILRQAKQDCMTTRTPIILLNLPDANHFADPHQQGIVEDCVSRLGLDYVDLTPVFTPLVNSPHKPFTYEFHFTAEGHRIIAEQLAIILKRKGLLSREAVSPPGEISGKHLAHQVQS